jgi:hypothetical protein
LTAIHVHRCRPVWQRDLTVPFSAQDAGTPGLTRLPSVAVSA